MLVLIAVSLVISKAVSSAGLSIIADCTESFGILHRQVCWKRGKYIVCVSAGNNRWKQSCIAKSSQFLCMIGVHVESALSLCSFDFFCFL